MELTNWHLKPSVQFGKKSEKDIVPAPGMNKSMMAASIPHFVSARAGGQYSYDNSCLQWKSSGICSHVVSVAEKNHELFEFLEWYNTNQQEPNITTLAMSGLPAGRGRKGGISKRKRCASSRKAPETIVSRPAIQLPPRVTVQDPEPCIEIQQSGTK